MERFDRFAVNIVINQTGSFTMPRATKKSHRNRTKTAHESWATSNYFLDDALALAGTLAERKKEWGAEKISEFAEATREFAASMTSIPNLGNYVNAAAESLEDFSDYVSQTEFEQIVVDASTFARRHPVVVMTGGVLAGLAVVEVLRARGPGPNFGRSAKSRKLSGGPSTARAGASGSSKRVNGHAHLNS
jgi:hypothetical protein